MSLYDNDLGARTLNSSQLMVPGAFTLADSSIVRESKGLVLTSNAGSPLA